MMAEHPGLRAPPGWLLPVSWRLVCDRLRFAAEQGMQWDLHAPDMLQHALCEPVNCKRGGGLPPLLA